MNGDPLYHWIALGVSTVVPVPVPVPVAILAEWTPPWMRKRRAGMRFRAYGVLCTYGLMLVNGIPRIADAAVPFLLAERKDSGARVAAQPYFGAGGNTGDV
ncbi:hypothetical protein [Streptomyces sp. NBC_00690]|uniref:hypothetical protein n=1 Tax=Streptomyces sp. NBC_00690 TaxID=2975808 RepID=UPI002E2861A5|nr:hypothetical protein [Streptomyces sp. NBC_00690]